MDSFRLVIKASAERDITAIPFPHRRSLVHAILALKRDPCPPRSEPLPHSDGRRLRVAGYRVVYLIDHAAGTLRVIRIAR